MRWLAALTLSACSFRANVAPGADALADAAPDAAGDAAPDAAAPACTVGVTSTPGTDRGRVGGNGGGDNLPPLACDGDDRIVGVAVRMSDQNTLFGARSAHALQIACAPVRVDAAGVGTTGTIYTREAAGNGEENWTPSTLSPITQCQPGWIVNGLQTHTGPNNNLFAEVRIRCGKLDATAQTVANEVLYVMGSLTQPAGVDTINCNAGEIVVQLANRTGSGLDSVNLFCAPARCL